MSKARAAIVRTLHPTSRRKWQANIKREDRLDKIVKLIALESRLCDAQRILLQALKVFIRWL